MKKGLTALVLIAALAWTFCSLPAVVWGDFPDRPGDAEDNVLEGKLTGYGKNHVEVDGRRVRLCKEAMILDPEENPITVSGLCATESVRVTLGGSCAAEVQVLILRR